MFSHKGRKDHDGNQKVQMQCSKISHRPLFITAHVLLSFVLSSLDTDKVDIRGDP